MQRALELALLGSGNTYPNPMVGCVIVSENGKIIGEGYHKKYGGAHAEVEAIRSVENQQELKNSIVYVTLEPCSHFGKTPPCADLLVNNNIKKVYISNLDPNPLVAGKGIQKLKDAGIEVELGLLKKTGEEVNKRFFTFHRKKRPYIILKWAKTNDGFIARKNFDSKWISSDESRKLVHKWRSEENAIMVGFRTALHDNPKLDVREWKGRNPIRLFFDRELNLPSDHHLLDGSIPTICFTNIVSKKEPNLEYVAIGEADILAETMKYLYGQNITSVFVEGGSNLLSKLIEKDLWDEARVFTSEKMEFCEGINAPQLTGRLVERVDIVGKDTLEVVRNS